MHRLLDDLIKLGVTVHQGRRRFVMAVWKLTGEEFVKNGPNSVDIGTFIDSGRVMDNFWSCISWGAKCRIRFMVAYWTSETKVSDFRRYAWIK